MFLYEENDVNSNHVHVLKFKNSVEKCKKIRGKNVLQSGRNGLNNI